MNGDSARWVIGSFDPTSWRQSPSMEFPKTEDRMMEATMAQLICVVEIIISAALVAGGIWGMVQ